MSIRLAGAVVLLSVSLLLTACGEDSDSSGTAGSGETLSISAIPDQDPSELSAREEALADYLGDALDVEVEYVPVTDYAASVNLFKAGDLDMVFYGGLTGVQARLQTPGANLLAQRDIDEKFQSVFIANKKAGIAPVTDVDGLEAFAGKRFTFGSEPSTSGRVMPEYFLDEAGVDSSADFKGEPGYSGSHDKTIDVVTAGSYDGGALNVQVWDARKKAGTVDLDKVVEVFRTPSYHDYHWMSGPDVDERFGDGFTDRLRQALLDLDGSTPAEAKVLELYGAKSVIATKADNYDQIEEIARKLGLVS